MATTPSPYPAFPSATTYPPHPYGCYYPPPTPYPSSIQIHDGYYAPPPYLAGYGSSPPTFPNPHPTSAYAPVPDFPYPLPLASPHASTAPPATDSFPSPAHHTSSGRPIHSLHHHHFPPTSDHLLVHAAPQPTVAPTAPVSVYAPAPIFPTTAPTSKMQPDSAPLLKSTTASSTPFNATPPTCSSTGCPHHHPLLKCLHADAYPAPPPGFVPSPAYRPPPAPAYAPPPPVPYPPPTQAYGPFGYYPAAATPRQDFALHTEKSGSATACKDCVLLVGTTGNDCLYANAFDCSPEMTSTDAAASIVGGSSASSTTTAPSPAFACATATEDFSFNLVDTTPPHHPRQHAQEQSALDAIQGELAQLTAMASQLAVSIGKRSTSAHNSTPTASASSASFLAPHVFGEMPTPNFGHGSPIIAPRYENCCLGYSNPVQNSCVQGGSTNLSEQHIDGLPHHYGFDNLKRQSLFLADGSEHSYYKLPGNYPLERAIPEQLPEDYQLEQATKPMSPPTEKNVGVMVPPYVAAQTAGLASVCSLKDNTTTSSDSLLVPSLQLPMNVQQASADVFVGIPEQQKFEDQQQVQVLKPLFEQLLRISSRAPETEQTSADMLDFTLEQQQQNDENTSANVQQLRDSQLTVLAIHERRSEWDPGDTSLHFLFTTAAGATKLDYAAVYKSAMAESLCATTAVQVTDCMQYIASNGINHIMQSAAHLPQGNYLCFLYYNSVLKTGYQGMRYVWAFSIAKGRQVQWDPGIELIMFLYKQTHAHIIQLVDLTSTATDDFLQGQQPCLHICLYCPNSDPLQQLVCYSSMFSSSAMSMSTAATLHVSLVLSSGKTAQEEKYAAAMYQLLKPQIPMRKTSRIWDPGIEFILYELWWFSKGTGYVLRHLLAVKFGTPSYTYSSDTAANMYCPPANLIQQRRNTAALLQFGHSAVCVWDPGIAFVYQQGVQENHNGKQLLASSKNCLHIWEIDILFITFLPP